MRLSDIADAVMRLADVSGPEVLQRIQTLLSDPINPGSDEAKRYILQGQPTPDELRRWMAQAYADMEVSDDGNHAKEDALAARLASESPPRTAALQPPLGGYDRLRR